MLCALMIFFFFRIILGLFFCYFALLLSVHVTHLFHVWGMFSSKLENVIWNLNVLKSDCARYFNCFMPILKAILHGKWYIPSIKMRKLRLRKFKWHFKLSKLAANRPVMEIQIQVTPSDSLPHNATSTKKKTLNNPI